MWHVSGEIKMAPEVGVLVEDAGVGEMIDVVEIVVEVMVEIVVEIVVDLEDCHMTTIVGMVLLNGTVIAEVEIEVEEIGTMIIEDVGIDLPWEEVAIEVALPVVVVATVVAADPGLDRLGDTAPGVLLGMLEEEVAMTTVVIAVVVLGTMVVIAVVALGTMVVIAVVLETMVVIAVVLETMVVIAVVLETMVVIAVVLGTMVIGVVLGTMIIGIEALMATVNATDIEEDAMIADIVLEQYRVNRRTICVDNNLR
jgi:hypothetical protein